LTQTPAANATVVLGFTLMRVALVALWLRAAEDHPERRVTCRRYAAGIGVLQLAWIAWAIWTPADWQSPFYGVLMVLELAVPVWAERAGETPWHPHHVAERYGLFTIILLGECMVGADNVMKGVLDTQGWSLDLAIASIAVPGLILGLWWAYFLVPFAQVLHHRRERGFLWGYGHAAVFAALAVLGGVLEVVADALRTSTAHSFVGDASHGAVTPLFAISLTAASVSVFLGALWWLGAQTTRRQMRSPAYVLPPLIASEAAVMFVDLGMPMAWGLLLLAAGPALMIAWVIRDRHQWPEAFAVQ
jgi:low temperature requirement protein LtrA